MTEPRSRHIHSSQHPNEKTKNALWNHVPQRCCKIVEDFVGLLLRLYQRPNLYTLCRLLSELLKKDTAFDAHLNLSHQWPR